MKLFKILVFAILPVAGFSQKQDPAKDNGIIVKEIHADPNPVEIPTEKEDNNLYNTAGVDKRPDFPGGLQEFYKYIGKNYKTPDVKGLTGKVFVTFVVDKDGSLTDIKILRDIGYGTGEEAVRVLKGCPNWIPAELNGKKVRVLYSLPISL